MGVPKFTRFICERYPCLLEVLNEYQIPEFDNLYLDMNGIIHCCSHPNDADAHFRITEETIFKNIFLYIEILFRTIKPQKLFFMAVDGVAPRAKINQQRSRRFKSAREAELTEARARAQGEKLPEEARFDSNCITPGTLFMSKLTQQLKYFVAYKISTDKSWQKCKIILSGPEVPGEGEHKIMDYIRWMKSQPNHDPNTRHCLYGLDADLIMLSLCTHEPHFAVLREEVKYGKNPQKTTTPPEKTKFCLLHISLLREYLEHEFESIKDKLPFKFDLEKLIDDWILMGFLIGNDFIPHLPNLHIAHGALPILYEAYMSTLPTLDGYINENGKLNLERFEKFMEKLSGLDVKNFTEHAADLKYFESKISNRSGTNCKNYSPIETTTTTIKKSIKKDLENLIQSTDDMLLGHSDEEQDFLIDSDNSDDDDHETYALEFIQHKQDYYIKKFEYEKIDESIMRQQAEAYVTAIQWNLHYYYDGCCSWSWYYPHHYAPFMSDIKDFKNLKLNFEIGEPFLPFQQLLAVLPAASKSLLPEAYQGLLTEAASPIINYYPHDFKTDLNEKKQEWEAIVLIPFIDEKNLIDAMEPYNIKLTQEERDRNKHGPMSVYTWTHENLGIITGPEYFPTITSHAKITLIHPNELEISRENLKKGLCDGVKLNIYFPGFPTLQHIKHEAKLEKAKVKVFEQPSRNENMMLNILSKESPSIDKLATELLGKTVFIKWPHLLEALVIGISDGSTKIILKNSTCENLSSLDNLHREELKGGGQVEWTSHARNVAMGYKNRFGIIVGDIDTLIHAKPINGRRYILTSQGRMSLEKEWSNIPCHYPYQSIVHNIEVERNSGDISHFNISDIYKPNSTCFMLGHPHYGAMGQVVEPGINQKTGRVKVAMTISIEPNFTNLKREHEEIKMQYMHGSIAAQRLGISSHLLSRITGSIFVLPSSTPTSENIDKIKQQNIGLNLKFNKKNEELPGFTRKIDGTTWLYSSKSIGLIRSYMEKWPKLFEKLVHQVGNDVFNEQDLFDKDEDVMQIVSWLKQQSYKSIEFRNSDHEGLDPDLINKLEREIDEFLKKNEKTGEEGEESGPLLGKAVIMQVKPHLLYTPGINHGNIPPDRNAKNYIFDRIISVKENSSVPLGYHGTIIGIEGVDGEENHVIYHVLFDKPFIGNISFHGQATTRRYKLHASEFINTSHGTRAEQYIPPGIPDKIVRKKQDSTNTSDAQGNSAFASFNKTHGNFFPVFSKNKNSKNIHVNSQNNQSASGTVTSTETPKTRIIMKKGNQIHQQVVKNPPQIDNNQGTTAVTSSSSSSFSTASTTTISESESRKTQGNSTEFQMLWNELAKLGGLQLNQKPMIAPFPPQSKPPPIPPGSMVAPPGQSGSDTIWDMTGSSTPQDPSAFLKAVLKIPDDNSTTNNNDQKSKKPPITTNIPFTFPPRPPAPPTSNVPPPTSNAPTMVQQLFDHARQQVRKENFSYCARLLNHFQLLRIGMPRYFYSTQKNLILAQIILPDMRAFNGELSTNHELAAESAAKRVYYELGLDKAPKPRSYLDLLPPDAWLNIQQPVNVPIMSPRSSFPDPQKPPVRPPANWNSKIPPGQPGFTQMPPPLRMNHTWPQPPRPSPPLLPLLQNDNKIEIKQQQQTTSFVPLQAQKKTSRSRSAKEDVQETGQNIKEIATKASAKSSQNNSPKITKREKSIKDHEINKSVNRDNPSMPPSSKNPRPRRSRIAANFAPSSDNRGDK